MDQKLKNSLFVTIQWPIFTIYIKQSKDFPLSISLILDWKAGIEHILYISQAERCQELKINYFFQTI